MYQPQNYNYYQQPPQQIRPAMGIQPTAPNLKGRPVSSLDEVRATAVDFDGSIFYFPNLANDKIYTKQINLDGTSTVRVYELAELPAQQQPIGQVSNLVTKEEFEKTINSLLNEISTLKSAVPVQPTESATTADTFNF